MTVGDIYTVAGDGLSGTGGNNGSATSASIGDSSGASNFMSVALTVGVDSHGNLLIADAGHNEVRVVAETSGTYYGKSMTSGDIYLVAGDGTSGYSGDKGSAPSAELDLPQGVAADSNGNLIIGDTGNFRARVVATTTGTYYGVAMTAGDIYTVGGNGYQSYSGNGGPSGDAQLYAPMAVATDASNNVVIADTQNEVIRVAARASGTFYGQSMSIGSIYVIAGNGVEGYSGDNGPATSAELDTPEGVAVDSAGNVIISDNLNNRVRVVAEQTGTYYGVSMKAGDIYTVAGNGTQGYAGDNGAATSAELNGPVGVAVDSSGNIIIGDTGNSRVRVVAGSTGTFYETSMTAGDIYTIAGSGEYGGGTDEMVGSGNAATSAIIASPEGVAVDQYGNVVVTDTTENRVWFIDETSGTYYGTQMFAGNAYAIAGTGFAQYVGDEGPAVDGGLSTPVGVTVDPAGNILVADSGNNVVRIITASTGTFYGQNLTAGDIYTVAGNGIAGFSGEDNFPTVGSLNAPNGVAIDQSGNLLVADTQNNRVRYLHDAESASSAATVAG
jgi:hypothetical protein